MMTEEIFLKKIKLQNETNYSPLNLAYIGDAVFEMLVRSFVMKDGNKPVNELNKTAASIVNAASQAKMYHRIEGELTQEEQSVLRRGRNAKSNTHAKNASITDYRHATGLEALFGYLYMNHKIDRIMELFEICIKDH